MSISGRKSRPLLGALLVGALLATATGCSDSPDPAAKKTVELRFSWWGSDARAKTTQQMIEVFQHEHPNIRIKGESRDFNSYFDTLNTQVAANDAPDIITMGGAYPSEYGNRGMLLDLNTVADTLKTDKIDAAALSSGKVGNKQYGVPTGVNTYTVIADPMVFEKAGVALPDDEKWTWKDFAKIARKIAKKAPKGTWGAADFTSPDLLDLYGRQRGESLYTPDGGVAISAGTLQDLWVMTSGLLADGATPSAAETSELASQPAPEQTLMGRGLAGMQFDWSNQLGAMTQSSGHTLTLLRAPGEADAEQRGMWLQASQFYTVNSASKHPREAAQFVDFLVNSVEAGKLVLTDRGIPANSTVRDAIQKVLPPEQVAQLEFIDEVSQQMGPALVIGPPGSTDAKDILRRINGDVLSGRMKPKAASKEFLRLLKVALRSE